MLIGCIVFQLTRSQGLCVRGAGSSDSAAHVSRLPVRHAGQDDRQHAQGHLQEDHDRAEPPAQQIRGER